MMVVGRKMRLAVFVMAEASVPSRRRRALGAGSQGTVTMWRLVRVIGFAVRSGCHALVAAMAYIAGQQRRIAAMCCRLHSAQVLPQRIVRRDSFSTGSAARVWLETGHRSTDRGFARHNSPMPRALCLQRAGAALERQGSNPPPR